MLEILYRIYEVADKEIPSECQAFGMSSLSKSNSYEVAMDCLICDSRDEFKALIRDVYGSDIKFAYSRKYAPGTLYCIIIGETCYNTESYFFKREFECPYCKAKVTGYIPPRIYIDDYTIKHQLCSQWSKYQKLYFCSHRCREAFIKKESENFVDEDVAMQGWISENSFDNSTQAGYIYLITKKSTGQFYVGQTSYVPVFRWGQHLKTERFPVENIEDYTFEVLEVVPTGENILEREKHWIQEMYKSAPELSLNIACTKNISEDE